MTIAPVRPALPADRATQHRRCLRMAATLLGIQLRARLRPATRDRLQLCSAARILTALDVVVRVIPPGATWPRSPHVRLVVPPDTGWLGDLAVLTAVPRNVPGWADVADRAFPGWPGRRPGPGPAASPDAAAWSVVVRYRTDAGPLEQPPTALPDLLGARDLVVEVHLLQAPAPAIPAPRRAAPDRRA